MLALLHLAPGLVVTPAGLVVTPAGTPAAAGWAVRATVSMKNSADNFRYFTRFDHDQSQSLDFDEFLAMQPPEVRYSESVETIKGWFDAADLDGDGVLSVNEFLIMNGMMAAPGEAAQLYEQASTVVAPPPTKTPSMADFREFMKWDVDQSGYLDFEEFIRMQCDGVKNVWERKFTDDELKKLFDEADIDGDGRLSPNEFFIMNGKMAALGK